MKKIYRIYLFCLLIILIMSLLILPAFAAQDMWTVAKTITSSRSSTALQRLNRNF